MLKIRMIFYLIGYMFRLFYYLTLFFSFGKDLSLSSFVEVSLAESELFELEACRNIQKEKAMKEVLALIDARIAFTETCVEYMSDRSINSKIRYQEMHNVFQENVLNENISQGEAQRILLTLVSRARKDLCVTQSIASFLRRGHSLESLEHALNVIFGFSKYMYQNHINDIFGGNSLGQEKIIYAEGFYKALVEILRMQSIDSDLEDMMLHFEIMPNNQNVVTARFDYFRPIGIVNARMKYLENEFERISEPIKIKKAKDCLTNETLKDINSLSDLLNENSEALSKVKTYLKRNSEKFLSDFSEKRIENFSCLFLSWKSTKEALNLLNHQISIICILGRKIECAEDYQEAYKLSNNLKEQEKLAKEIKKEKQETRRKASAESLRKYQEEEKEYLSNLEKLREEARKKQEAENVRSLQSITIQQNAKSDTSEAIEVVQRKIKIKTRKDASATLPMNATATSALETISHMIPEEVQELVNSLSDKTFDEVIRIFVQTWSAEVEMNYNTYALKFVSPVTSDTVRLFMHRPHGTQLVKSEGDSAGWRKLLRKALIRAGMVER